MALGGAAIPILFASRPPLPGPALPCAAEDPPEGPRWEMVGLVPLFDPPRHDTKETIERCHEVRCPPGCVPVLSASQLAARPAVCLPACVSLLCVHVICAAIFGGAPLLGWEPLRPPAHLHLRRLVLARHCGPHSHPLQMGISVKMITGDQLLIGKETAKQLGMGTNMFTTEALMKARRPPGAAVFTSLHGRLIRPAAVAALSSRCPGGTLPRCTPHPHCPSAPHAKLLHAKLLLQASPC